MISAFRALFFGSTLLCTAAGLLVIASVFIQDRAPHSATMLGVSLVVSGVFLGAGVLLHGIQSHVAGIAKLARANDGNNAGDIERHVARLLIILILGGTALFVFLGVLTYAILARIDQGFAVFG